jgi:hypothetical protein
MRQNSGMVPKGLEASKKKLRTLKQRFKFIDLYHN